ncbi:hypothetical protein [Legionella impletisoli]|uniref:hypothetical protein n=1 Tax=Legionella impletisoli TaxID=343510 RepID=UPI0013EF7B04|nr:hypothetical protein [Legionella impletisoli]
MRRYIIGFTLFVSTLALGGCGVYTASCGATCARPVATYTTCCATCNPCYGYGYGWY